MMTNPQSSAQSFFSFTIYCVFVSLPFGGHFNVCVDSQTDLI